MQSEIRTRVGLPRRICSPMPSTTRQSACENHWCPRSGSNRHARRHWFLRPARLPLRHRGKHSRKPSALSTMLWWGRRESNPCQSVKSRPLDRRATSPCRFTFSARRIALAVLRCAPAFRFKANATKGFRAAGSFRFRFTTSPGLNDWLMNIDKWQTLMDSNHR